MAAAPLAQNYWETKKYDHHYSGKVDEMAGKPYVQIELSSYETRFLYASFTLLDALDALDAAEARAVKAERE